MDTNLIIALLQTSQGCIPRCNPVFTVHCTRQLPAAASEPRVPPSSPRFSLCHHSDLIVPISALVRLVPLSTVIAPRQIHHTWLHSSFRSSLICHFLKVLDTVNNTHCLKLQQHLSTHTHTHPVPMTSPSGPCFIFLFSIYY